ncbi:MAG: thioesterase family protein [Acidimicrobiia bacterium]|nr:thioesterase family protein [Acidimicrobiia bacterium]
MDEVDFDALIDLAPGGVDHFIGITPRYRLPRVFGGQLVAQALRAAQATVAADVAAHSLHASFLRPGMHGEPLRFEVERLRDGRSFVTRRVVARQDHDDVLHLSASFQRDEDGPDVAPSAPPDGMIDPDELPDNGWGSVLRRRPELDDGPHQRLWIAMIGEPSGDDRRDRCGLTFLTDSMVTTAVRRAHPRQIPAAEARRYFRTASLVAEVFTRDGVHVLTVVQEILIRAPDHA